MKILFVNTTAQTGGASIACQRLMRALEGQGHEVRLFVRDDRRLGNRLRFLWERLRLLLYITYARVFSIDDAREGVDIAATDDYAWADAVHLHWVNQALLSTDGLAHLLRRCKADGKRVLWTLHDIWPATGLCHLPGACDHWQKGCGHCPLLRRSGPNDLSARTFRRKERAYSEGDIRFVACSHYLADSASLSPLLSHHTIHVIANPLDTNFFAPAAAERRALGLPEDKRLVLFVAYNVNDANKDFGLVASAVERLVERHPEERGRIAVVPVGKHASEWRERFPCEVFPFEYVADRATMRDLYRASDVLVVASRMENLPNTIAEAKACGVPVVATRVGGIPEMVRHGVDGYLVGAGDADGMAEGLYAVISHPDYAALSAAAREDAVNNYSEANIARRYEALYQ